MVRGKDEIFILPFWYEYIPCNQTALMVGARFLDIKEFHLIIQQNNNTTEVIDLKNLPFANLNEINDSGKYH